MENIVIDKPNLQQPEVVPVKEASVGLDQIAAKMAAMRAQADAQRNQTVATRQSGTGSSEVATEESPVAPQGQQVSNEDVADSDTNLIEPETDELEAEYSESNEQADAPQDEVSEADSSPGEIIDFLQFAEQNPNAKFKFMRNGKEIEIDAKKAAAILGQGAAVSEEARQLKVQKAEFDEYLNQKKAETDGLMLAMEFTVRPQLQKAYDEIIKVQQYQNVFKQQLAQTRDPVKQAQIEANMQQNEQYLQRMAQTVNRLKPNVEQFYQMRGNQVREVLESNRQQFQDKELKNRAIWEETRDKVAKGWAAARNQMVPGVDNIDLISSDEHILSLLRDGLKYRDRPKAKSAGSSFAAVTTRNTRSQVPSPRQQDQVSNLREKANRGDRKAGDDLLVAHLNAIRASRGARR